MNVAIAHPDAAIRVRLEALIRDAFGVESAWEADDYEDTLNRTRREPPELLLLSLDLPGGRVQDLTKEIVEATGCAILLLEGGVPADVATVFDCLGNGAMDVARLPSNPLVACSEDFAMLRERFSTLKTLIGPQESVPLVGLEPAFPSEKLPLILALGASTGGPKALAAIIESLPVNFPAAVLIVQHLDAHFYAGLADWLANGSKLPVHSVDRPVSIESGQIYVAARPEHMVLSPGKRLSFTREWSDLICRPSIDVLFKSIAGIRGVRGVAALLTGMGRDGAEGLLSLRRAGFYTLAQDAPSSVVYGMPRVAAEIGAATTVLPLSRMGQWMVDKIQTLAITHEEDSRS